MFPFPLTWKRLSLFATTGVSAAVLFLLTTAWFQIQAVRWGYRTQELRQKLDDLEKTEQVLDQRLQKSLSLSRLDDLGKNRFRLGVPDPSQIVLLPEN